MKSLYTIVLTLFVTLSVGAQDIDYARHIIDQLSSPAFAGRGYVDGGDRASAEFIAGEFRTLGLLPVSGDTYFQPFNISVNTFPGRVSLKLNGAELKPGVDFLVESSSPSAEGRYKVIVTSRGRLRSESDMATLARDGAGAFVLIDCRNRKAEKPEESKRTDDYINFLKYSPQTAVKGVIIYTDEKLTWEASTAQNVRPVITVNREMDLSVTDNAEIAIDAKLIRKYETQNVVGMIKGTSASDSMIVVTAHYDHLGKMGSDVYFPGANDNASGVALMLNLAKHYSLHPPRYTMVFIALSAEELGLLGAKAFTDKPLIDLKKVKFLVNFDLAGTGDEGIKIVNGSVFKDKFELMSSISQQQQLLPGVFSRGAACNSDHCFFYQKGVPCFYIYTLGGIQAYHDLSDRPETLPLTEFEDYCRLMIGFFDRI